MALLLSTALLLFAQLANPGATSAGEPLEDGAYAPPGRWVTAGGAPARTAHSLARPITGVPEEAWRLAARGEIEGEPLLWDGHVFVSARESKTRRSIQVLEITTGRTLAYQKLAAELPLQPAVGEGRIAVRPAADRIDLYRVRGQRLVPTRTVHARGALSPPLIHGGELHVRVDDELVRYDLDRNEPVWRARVDGVFRGRPALRGEHVFALWYSGEGRAHVACVRRADGSVVASVEAGHHGGVVPPVDASGELFVHEDNLFLRYPIPVQSESGDEFHFGRIGRPDRPELRQPPALHRLLADPLPWESGWLVLAEEADGRSWYVARPAGDRLSLLVLADATTHPDLLETPYPTSRARDVAHLGGLAVRQADHEVLWRRPTASRTRPVPADGMLFVVEEPRTLLALREKQPQESPARVEALATLADQEAQVGEGFVLLARTALRFRDLERAERLLFEAVRRGAGGRSLDVVSQELERLAATESRPTPLSPRNERALVQEEESLRAKAALALLERARASRSPELVRAYLRVLLEHQPGHLGAAEAIAGMLPADAPRGATFDPASWLDFLDAHARSPVRFVRPGAGGTPRNTPELALLAKEAREWRGDVVGHRSERLFVVAPPGRPGAVARCLQVGELVCGLLESIFDVEPARDAAPLSLLLYETRDEYVSQSTSAGSAPELALGWTSGHYNPAENVSRMFVPEDDAALQRLLGVYAHELTHHWLETRAPFSHRAPDPDRPGFWIVEGFATLLGEFELDPHAGTWNVENPRAASLDAVANAPAEHLVPWDRLLGGSRVDYLRLDPEPDFQLPLTWRLGAHTQVGEMQTYYSQAGALCHYLFRTSPATRARLLDVVRAWYEGRPGPESLAASLGLTPAELGARVVAFARGIVNAR